LGKALHIRQKQLIVSLVADDIPYKNSQVSNSLSKVNDKVDENCLESTAVQRKQFFYKATSWYLFMAISRKYGSPPFNVSLLTSIPQ
jgi:hypothetical protein